MENLNVFQWEVVLQAILYRETLQGGLSWGTETGFNSSIICYNLASGGIHLNYGGTAVLCEVIAFYLSIFLRNKANKNTELFD